MLPVCRDIVVGQIAFCFGFENKEVEVGSFFFR